MAERPAQRPFIILPAFSRLRNGELVRRIKDCVTKHDGSVTVKVGTSSFSNNFEPCPAWARKQRGVGILIDSHFLDRRLRDTWTIRLHAIHYQRNAVRTHCIVVEEA